MSAKKKAAKVKHPKKEIQIKKTSDFVYEIIDPVTGGIWIYGAESDKTEEEIMTHLVRLMTLMGVVRPEKGQIKAVKSFS